MLPCIYFLALLPLTIGKKITVVQSNDDGWAEINIREFYYSLTRAGFDSVISAPADNKSGTGSFDAEPSPVGSRGCEFNSCPPMSPAIGRNSSMPRFNYVNSFPVTSIRHGIQSLSPLFFNTSSPDLAVAGPNVGNNLGITVLGSGTVGAATEAVKLGVPGIAFSGATGEQTAWNATDQGGGLEYVGFYAGLATVVTRAVTETGRPYLPEGVWLNVNFPEYETGTCFEVAQAKFVLTRIFPAIPFLTPRDVVTCGNSGRLPTERSVVNTDGCYVSVSVGNANSKLDATLADQTFVLKKLQGLLSCLPASQAQTLL